MCGDCLTWITQHTCQQDSIQRTVGHCFISLYTLYLYNVCCWLSSTGLDSWQWGCRVSILRSQPVNRELMRSVGYLLLACLMGQCCFARWRLSASSVVVCNAACGRLAHGRSDGRARPTLHGGPVQLRPIRAKGDTLFWIASVLASL